MEHDPNQPPTDDLESYVRNIDVPPIDPEVLEVLRKFPAVKPTPANANGQPEPEHPPQASKQVGPYVPTHSVKNWLNIEPEAPEPLLTELFEKGDKILLVGQSKTRKSFFALQMAFSLASGRGFLEFPALEPCRVLIIQSEIRDTKYHARCYRLAQKLDITPSDIEERLMVICTRGLEDQLGIIRAKVAEHKPNLVILDPFYKLVEGDESKIDDVKPVLKFFDSLAETHKVAVMYTHHDKKGFSGDNQLTDRGAGTGVLARDFDAAIFLSPHESENETLVCEFIARNYRSPDPFCAQWLDYGFFISDLEPKKKTSRSSIKEKKDKLSELITKAKKMLVDCYMAGEVHQTSLMMRARLEDYSIPRNKISAVMDQLEADCFIETTKVWRNKTVTILDKCLGEVERDLESDEKALAEACKILF